MLPLLSLALLAGGIVALALASEIQTTVAFVLDKGGLWLSYSTGLGRLRVTGFQLRFMAGHEPRAWKKKVLSVRYRASTAREVLHKTKGRKRWRGIQIPLKSVFDLGVRTIIRELDVNASIGVEQDAAATALVCGCLNTALQAVRSASARGEFVPRGIVAVRPVFSGARLSIRFKCILAIKTRHIIREIFENRTRRSVDGQSSD